MIAILKKQLALPHSLHTILQILGTQALWKIRLSRFGFGPTDCAMPYECHQPITIPSWNKR